jgi:hypothetical protein
MRIYSEDGQYLGTTGEDFGGGLTDFGADLPSANMLARVLPDLRAGGMTARGATTAGSVIRNMIDRGSVSETEMRTLASRLDAQDQNILARIRQMEQGGNLRNQAVQAFDRGFPAGRYPQGARSWQSPAPGPTDLETVILFPQARILIAAGGAAGILVFVNNHNVPLAMRRLQLSVSADVLGGRDFTIAVNGIFIGRQPMVVGLAGVGPASTFFADNPENPSFDEPIPPNSNVTVNVLGAAGVARTVDGAILCAIFK